MKKDGLNKKKFWTDWFYMILPVITVVLFLGIWQILSSTHVIDPGKAASPVDIGKAFVFKLSNNGPDGSLLTTNILSSMSVALAGFLLASVIGIPLGLFMGWYPIFDKFMKPIFEIIRPIPPVAWIPIIILWIGLGLPAKALIIFLAAFVPCVINTYAGIRQTSPALINVAKTFGASNFYTFVHIGIPSSVPMMFAGLRVALANSWATLVAAEMLSASSGLGFMISMARSFMRIDIVMMGMIVIGIIGFIFTGLFSLLEKKVLKGRAV